MVTTLNYYRSFISKQCFRCSERDRGGEKDEAAGQLREGVKGGGGVGVKFILKDIMINGICKVYNTTCFALCKHI